MPTCQHCGTVAPEGRVMCPACRRRMTAPTADPATSTTTSGWAPLAGQPPAPPPPPPASSTPPAGAPTSAPASASPDRSGRRPRPVGALAWWLVSLLALVAILDVVSIITELHRASLADNYRTDRSITLRDLGDADDAVAMAAGLWFLAYLVTGVLFVIWLYRACRRVENTLRYRPGWAIGGWFVPIWALFRPKQMVDDVWKGTADRTGLYTGVPVWIHLWWAAWLVSTFFSWIVVRVFLDADTLSAVVVSDRAGAASDAVDIVTAGLAICLVAALSRRLARVPQAVSWNLATTPQWRLNSPPGWPSPPAGWTPPPGWQPDPSWPAPPPGWVLWLPANSEASSHGRE